MAVKPVKNDKKNTKTEVDPDDFMSKAELKAVLAVAEGGPGVPCALGMTRDKQFGFVMLAKRGRLKAVMDDMKDTAEELGVDLDLGALRYGRASVDPKTGIIFRVHKDPPSAMWTPIQRRMRQAGYGQILITTDLSLALEPDGAAAAPAGATPPSGTAPSGTAPSGTAPSGTAPSGTAPSGTAPSAAPAADTVAPGNPTGGNPTASPAAPPAGDATLAAEQAARIKELTATLAGLLKQVAAALMVTPALKENLLPIAAAARTALHDGKPDIAADLIETLDDELKAAPTATDAAAGPAAAAPNVKSIADKAQMAWGAYLKIAAREVGKLRAEVTSAYRDHGFGGEVDNFFRNQIDPALGRLQDSDLAAKLAAASKSADAGEQRKLLAEGVKILENLEDLVASDPVLKKLDDNPFTDLVIAKTATATLGTLKKTLQTAARE